MGVQREPGQKGVSWSNIAVGTFNPPSDATHVEPLLTSRPRIGGIMNMVITFCAVQVAFAKRLSLLCAV